LGIQALFIPAMRVLAENKDHEYPKIFLSLEIIFSKDTTEKRETGIMEKNSPDDCVLPGQLY